MDNNQQILKAGLEILGSKGGHFTANLCYSCDGKGRYLQWYTVGCGGGSYQSEGRCDRCDGYGILQGDKVAPQSIINQVVVAAAKVGVAGEYRKQW